MAGVVRRPRCSPGLGPGERSRARAPCLNSASCKKATICLPPRVVGREGAEGRGCGGATEAVEAGVGSGSFRARLCAPHPAPGLAWFAHSWDVWGHASGVPVPLRGRQGPGGTWGQFRAGKMVAAGVVPCQALGTVFLALTPLLL